MSIVEKLARSVSWTTLLTPALLTTTGQTLGGGVLRTPLSSRRAARSGLEPQMDATCRAVSRWERSKLSPARLPGTSLMLTSPTTFTFTLDRAWEVMAVIPCPTAAATATLPTSKITRLHLDRTLYKRVMSLARCQVSASQAATALGVTRMPTRIVIGDRLNMTPSRLEPAGETI
jgi:hypothetical protein